MPKTARLIMVDPQNQPTADLPGLPPAEAAPTPIAVARTQGPEFPVVGVGASAGGLDALGQLLRALPVDTGMAFVIVQHLAPERQSGLTEILSRATKMPASEVEGEESLEPNHVYVCPPACYLLLSGGKLRCLPQVRGPQNRGIDHFFRSLADECSHRAIAVVLSGALSDGTLGLEAVKAGGGITFAQDESARNVSMPRSAVASGCVDFVLPPAQIAQEIGRIARHPFVARLPELTPAVEPGYAPILQLLQRSVGVDFTHYKRQTLHRRITRRMVLQKLDSMQDYERRLAQDPEEVESLYQDILIHVTSFFRDPESFAALASQVFPKLLADRTEPEPLRIWTLGSSTGEEAYSLAMGFAECAEAAGSRVPVQVFATDLNPAGVTFARAGLYPKTIAQDVSAERLKRFFQEEAGGYRIGKAIRERCVFSRHNVLSDPPFSRVDLISCRNMLIYMEPVLQKQIVPLLHYALKPGGFLWLGSSETAGSARTLFEVVDAKHKIYVRRPGPSPAARPFLARGEAGGLQLPARPPGVPNVARGDLAKEAERILLARFAPPGVIISPSLEILQFCGETGPFLTPSPGLASLQLLKMLREGLVVSVRAAILRAVEAGEAVREEGLRVKSGADFRELDVEVIPLRSGQTKEGGFLVLFEEKAGPARAHAGASDSAADGDVSTQTERAENSRLLQELSATRDYLQSVIEQQEGVNEELQSANEEAQSTNEEMQSINEELETSKEEIQASNEELATVNDELNNRNHELSLVNGTLQRERDYSVSLVASLRSPLVVLDASLRVKTASVAFYETFQAVPPAVEGRLIYDLGNGQWNIPTLRLLLEDLLPREGRVDDFEVEHAFEHIGHRTMLLNARQLAPGFSDEPLIVLSIEDITERRQAEDRMRQNKALFAALLNQAPNGVFLLDGALRVQQVNPRARLLFSQIDQLLGRTFAEVMQILWGPALSQQLTEIFRHTLESGEPYVSPGFHERRADLGLEESYEWEIQRVLLPEGQFGVACYFTEVTARYRLEESLLARASDLVRADRSKDEFLAMLAHELRNPLAPLRNATEILRTPSASAEARLEAREILARQIENMSRMIDDLLDVSRITEGKTELRTQVVLLETVLQGAANLIQTNLTLRGQRLHLQLPAEPVFLQADSTRLEQLFGNLLTNASKYNNPGGNIWLSAQCEGTAESPEICVRVRDDGIGIAPELLPRIFDLFVQATRASDRAQGGLGIGLTLVQRLVAMHAGRVEAHSAGLGQGSEFVVWLPLLPSPAPLPPPTPDPAVEISRRILVVDDNEDSTLSMAMLQRLRGHETRTALNGLEAIAVAAEFLPQIVLLDVGLPGMDGLEVARVFRATPALAGCLLVAMTGYDTPADRARAHDAGFDRYLVKPVDLALLREWVAAWVATDQ